MSAFGETGESVLGGASDSILSSPPRKMASSPPRTPPRSGNKFGSPSSADRRRSLYGDRFIPSRTTTNLEEAMDILDSRVSSKDVHCDGSHENQALMNSLLRSELLGHYDGTPQRHSIENGCMGSPARKESSSTSSVFKYRSSTGSLISASDSLGSSGSVLDTSTPTRPRASLGASTPMQATPRRISRKPFKTLDAPELADDYYLNLMDWSSTNILAVALRSGVYLWSACTSKSSKLCDLGTEDEVTSISWTGTGQHMSIGTRSGKILVYDAHEKKLVRQLHGHDSRVGTMAWASNVLASGSRDRCILLQDVRIKTASRNSGGRSSLGGGSSSAHAHLARSPHHSISTATTTSSSSSSSGGGSGSGVLGMSPPPFPSGALGAGSPTPAMLLSSSSSQIDGSTTAPSVSALSNLSASLLPASTISPRPSPLAAGVDHRLPPTSPHTPNYGGSMPIFRPSSVLVPEASPLLHFDSLTSSTPVSTSGSVIKVLSAHRQEVCGLKWSFDEKYLASGGNDNKLFVWEPNNGSTQLPSTSSHLQSLTSSSSHMYCPLHRFEDHTAAVKAVAWSPHQNGLLASGGGTADRHVRFWNAITGVSLHKIDTQSQVCNLMWSKNVNELVSTHGYSLNQVIVWKYPSMQKIATLSGHTMRVLYLAMSPDGQTIVTGAGDETLRFWNVFPGPKNKGGLLTGQCALAPSPSDAR